MTAHYLEIIYDTDNFDEEGKPTVGYIKTVRYSSRAAAIKMRKQYRRNKDIKHVRYIEVEE